jgi:hypothetical protein
MRQNTAAPAPPRHSGKGGGTGLCCPGIKMEYEDDYPEELQIREREIALAKKVIEEQKNAHEEHKKVIKELKKHADDAD